MKLNATKIMIPICMAVVLLTGCANKDRQRIALLEGNNANLTNRYNNLRAELDSSNSANTDLQQQLIAKQNEINALDAQLADKQNLMLAAPGWTAVPTGAMISIEGSVLFSVGKIQLRKEVLRTLDAIVSTLQGEYGDHDILILGHTDDQPIKKSGWKDNLQLSSERAMAVARYLSERGINSSRLVTAGSGENRPRTANDTKKSRATNRRVEIYAVNPELQLGQP